MQIFFMLPLILIYVLFRSVVGTCVAIFTSQDCRGFPGCLRTVWQRTILWSHIILAMLVRLRLHFGWKNSLWKSSNNHVFSRLRR